MRPESANERTMASASLTEWRLPGDSRPFLSTHRLSEPNRARHARVKPTHPAVLSGA